MNNIDLLKTINNKLKENGISDVKYSDQGLIIPVESDNTFPSYKLAITCNEINNVSIYTSFYHQYLLKEEQKKLVILLNKFNQESILKFTMVKDFIKVSIELGEISTIDVDFVLRNITIFPTILSNFETDLLKVIK